MKRRKEPPRNSRTRPAPAPAAAAAAERDVAPARLPFAARKEQHAYAALSSLGRLLARPGATLLTLAMLALALLLPLLLATALRNLSGIDAALGAQRELTVFLDPSRGADAAQTARRALRALPGVADVALRTPEQGLSELRALSGFGPALALLEDNPLPFVLVVTPEASLDAQAIGELAANVGKSTDVDFVHYDLAWRERLARVAALARRGVEVLGVLFALGALLIVGNTIRLDVAGRRDEIQVMRVVGAAPAFIRRPFLYAGIWYGLGAALLALAGALAVFVALAPAVAALAQSYGAGVRLLGPGWAGIAGTPAAGIVLGWLGARVALAFELARARDSV